MTNEQRVRNALRTFNLSAISLEADVPYMIVYRFVRQDGPISEDNLQKLDDCIQRIIRGQ